MMKIVIPGGTGQVGTLLARAFAREGHEVIVLSRGLISNGRTADGPFDSARGRPFDFAQGSRRRRLAGWRVAEWDAISLGGWAAELEGADAVINLAGRSVNCRYTPENRRLIMDSRVNSTRVVGEAIARCQRPPRIWLQAGTATLYAHRYDAPNDEATGILGGAESDAPDTWQFSIGIATAWERAVNEVVLPRTRKVILRSAIAFSPDRGGAFEILLRLVRFGLGGKAGDGRQYVSWIHDADFVRAVSWLIEHDSISGAVNLAAPNPLPNEEFMRELRQAWGIRIGLPSPEWLLEIGARVIKTETELLLKSRRVVPGILTRSGFRFEFPTWREAARDLCRRWRELNSQR